MQEHEIPKGSKLYFGSSAKLKRNIENTASELLSESGFKEIITPYFCDTNTISNTKNTIQTNTEDNKFLSFRTDSTIEVLRLILNRLNNQNKKWFYIQPVFSYPSNEEYQIGIEYIDFQDMSYIISLLINLLQPHKLDYILQVSNINIVNLLINKYEINKEDLFPINLENLLALDIKWLNKLAHIQNLKDIEDISMYPTDIQNELVELKKCVQNISKNTKNQNIIIEPLYFDELKYYESIYFRAFSKNTLLAKGGIYKDSGVTSSGFAIYTDHLLSKILQKG